jgi:putative Holliday junction resolvase
MRYLAVDFGEKRIGLATSDASGMIATPRRTVPRQSDRAAIASIADFARREEVEGVVVGLPHHADGTENALAPRVRSFARKLEEALSLPVAFVDEHLTSHAAGDRFPGVEIDAAAAAVLLEDYLSERAR